MAEMRSRMVPIIEDAQAAIQLFTVLARSVQDSMGNVQHVFTDMQTITGRLERGDGSVGCLLTEDTLGRGLETILDQSRAPMQRLGAILTAMEGMVRHASALTATLNKYARELPQLPKRVDALLGPLHGVLEDLRRTTPELPQIAKSMADTTEALPLLVLRTEESLDSLEKLLRQLRSHWLLGGRPSHGMPDSPRRLPALDITP